ncbi:MAG: hypothetical protein NTX25_23080, partial [Proteobacteria bacterium]|nr:hypothetical protein [Pseudomonadota bacterium]
MNKMELASFISQMKNCLSFIVVISILFLLSCSKTYTPKPKGYNRIDLPIVDYEWIKDEHPY